MHCLVADFARTERKRGKGEAVASGVSQPVYWLVFGLINPAGADLL